MLPTAKEIIEKLNLLPHPEGGYFRETYRSEEIILSEHLPSRFKGNRSIATCIYYLLKDSDFSAFHRIKSDETWHYYSGEALRIYSINNKGKLSTQLLGMDVMAGQSPQITLAAGDWFSAHVADRKAYTLVGCTVAPGFDFTDFEMGKKEELINQFPDCVEVLTEFCL